MLTFDTQYKIQNLNRHEALNLLTSDFLSGLSLNEKHMFFGEATRPEFAKLDDAILREFRGSDKKELRAYLEGNFGEWDLDEWPLFKTTQKWALEGRKIDFVIDEVSLLQIPVDLARIFDGLLRISNIRMLSIPQPIELLNGGRLITEVIGDSETIKWGVSHDSALSLSFQWGNGALDQLMSMIFKAFLHLIKNQLS